MAGLTQTVVTPDYLTTSGTTFTSTNAFSPAAGAMVVVVVNLQTATSPTITLADSHGNSYTSAVTPAVNTGTALTTAVFKFTYSAAPGSTTLTVTSSVTASKCQISPVTFTGQAASQAGAGTLSATQRSGSFSTVEGSITTTAAGSLCVFGGTANGTVTPTAAAGTTTDANNATNPLMLSGYSTSATVTPGATTVGWTLSASVTAYTVAGLEILPVASGVLSHNQIVTQAVKRAALY